MVQAPQIVGTSSAPGEIGQAGEGAQAVAHEEAVQIVGGLDGAQMGHGVEVELLPVVVGQGAVGGGVGREEVDELTADQGVDLQHLGDDEVPEQGLAHLPVAGEAVAVPAVLVLVVGAELHQLDGGPGGGHADDLRVGLLLFVGLDEQGLQEVLILVRAHAVTLTLEIIPLHGVAVNGAVPAGQGIVLFQSLLELLQILGGVVGVEEDAALQGEEHDDLILGIADEVVGDVAPLVGGPAPGEQAVHQTLAPAGVEILDLIEVAGTGGEPLAGEAVQNGLLFGGDGISVGHGGSSLQQTLLQQGAAFLHPVGIRTDVLQGDGVGAALVGGDALAGTLPADLAVGQQAQVPGIRLGVLVEHGVQHGLILAQLQLHQIQ